MDTSSSSPVTDSSETLRDGQQTSPARSTVHDRTSASRSRVDRWLAAALGALAVVLAVNTVMGPLVLDAISYPFSETLVNQTIGLEAVTLVVVVPWAVVAAALVFRGHSAGPLAAIPPSAYAAYMFVQYVLGPQYVTYRPVALFHLGIFVLSGAVLVLAWTRIQPETLPALSGRRERRIGVVLLLFAAFITSRYVGALQGSAIGGPLPPEYASDPTMYWSIVFLDLGVVVPVSVATAVGLLRGASWARRAMYGVVGWYVLVPVSVAAMSAVMLANGDPTAAVGGTVVLAAVAVVFTAFAAWVYRPLFGESAQGVPAE